MKKTINLILLLTLLVFSTSCSEDNNENPPQKSFEELIIGEWNFVNRIINGEELPFEDPCHKEYETLIFSKDKTFEQTEYENISGSGCKKADYSAKGTWSINNNTLKFNQTNVEIITLNEDVFSFKVVAEGNTGIFNQKRKK